MRSRYIHRVVSSGQSFTMYSQALVPRLGQPLAPADEVATRSNLASAATPTEPHSSSVHSSVSSQVSAKPLQASAGVLQGAAAPSHVITIGQSAVSDFKSQSQDSTTLGTISSTSSVPGTTTSTGAPQLSLTQSPHQTLPVASSPALASVTSFLSSSRFVNGASEPAHPSHTSIQPSTRLSRHLNPAIPIVATIVSTFILFLLGRYTQTRLRKNRHSLGHVIKDYSLPAAKMYSGDNQAVSLSRAASQRRTQIRSDAMHGAPRDIYILSSDEAHGIDMGGTSTNFTAGGVGILRANTAWSNIGAQDTIAYPRNFMTPIPRIYIPVQAPHISPRNAEEPLSGAADVSRISDAIHGDDGAYDLETGPTSRGTRHTSPTSRPPNVSQPEAAWYRTHLGAELEEGWSMRSVSPGPASACDAPPPPYAESGYKHLM